MYHYHSVYDSQRFQELYSDPGFVRHVAVAKHLGLVTLRLLQPPLLPLNTTQYASELGTYLEKYAGFRLNLGTKLCTDSIRSALGSSLQRPSCPSQPISLDWKRLSSRYKMQVKNSTTLKSRRSSAWKRLSRTWRSTRNYTARILDGRNLLTGFEGPLVSTSMTSTTITQSKLHASV